MPGQDGGDITPVRHDGFWRVECMSADAANCFWGKPDTCATNVANAATYNLRPLKCPRFPTSGWCYSGAVALGLTTGKSTCTAF